MKNRIILPDEAATVNFAKSFAPLCQQGAWLYFSGSLGAGKTCFIRAFLQAYGITGATHSPTFTLIETYQQGEQHFYHLDCYRMESPQELIDIGVRDIFTPEHIILIEWPEKGQGVLPSPDCWLKLEAQESGRSLELTSHSDRGSDIISRCLRMVHG